jgi:hypothetical protein
LTPPVTPHATLSDRLRESADWYLKCSGHERDFIAARQMQEAATEIENLRQRLDGETRAKQDYKDQLFRLTFPETIK